jgi:hypothetical protein
MASCQIDQAVGENGAVWNTGQNETRTLFFVETNFQLVFAEKWHECFILPQTILRFILPHLPLQYSFQPVWHPTEIRMLHFEAVSILISFLKWIKKLCKFIKILKSFFSKYWLLNESSSWKILRLCSKK